MCMYFSHRNTQVYMQFYVYIYIYIYHILYQKNEFYIYIYIVWEGFEVCHVIPPRKMSKVLQGFFRTSDENLNNGSKLCSWYQWFGHVHVYSMTNHGGMICYRQYGMRYVSIYIYTYMLCISYPYHTFIYIYIRVYIYNDTPMINDDLS